MFVFVIVDLAVWFLVGWLGFVWRFVLFVLFGLFGVVGVFGLFVLHCFVVFVGELHC